MPEHEKDEDQLAEEELEEQNAEPLPDREAMSVVRDPFTPGADYLDPLPSPGPPDTADQ